MTQTATRSSAYRSTRTWALYFAPALLASVTGCSAPGGSGQRFDEVRSSHPRAAATAPASDVGQLVRDNTEFALRMHRALSSERGNVVFSPHSISVALAMTYAGATGSTASQLAEGMRFSLPAARLHAAFNTLDQQLAERERAAPEDGERPFRLRVANALFAQRGASWQAPFLDTLAENYNAGVSLLDIASNPEAARTLVNAWVSAQTESRIPELLQRGTITTDTRFVLTNAAYFNARWMHPFDAARTAPAPFTREGSAAATVPTMNMVRSFRYAQVDGWQAVELLYRGGQVSMLVALPPTGPIADAERSLDESRLRGLVERLGTRTVTLALPKFSFRTAADLNSALGSFGVRDLFAPGGADLSPMDGTRQLYVSHVVHEGYVAVDEIGTEAAAATAVIGEAVSLPEPATFIANRPFLFFVRDNVTGAVLFMGRVTDPSAS